MGNILMMNASLPRRARACAVVTTARRYTHTRSSTILWGMSWEHLMTSVRLQLLEAVHAVTFFAERSTHTRTCMCLQGLVQNLTTNMPDVTYSPRNLSYAVMWDVCFPPTVQRRRAEGIPL